MRGLAVTVALVLAACKSAPSTPKAESAPSPPKAKPDPAQVGKAWAKAREVVSGFDRGDVFLLNDENWVDFARPEGPLFSGPYFIRAPVKHLEADALGKLRAIDLPANALDKHDPSPLCALIPYVGLRLWKGSEEVELAFCFKCDQYQMSSADLIAALGDRTGNPAVGGGFRAAASALLTWSREQFPDDEALKADPSGY